MARDVEANVDINDRSSGGLRSFIANLRNADKVAKDVQKDFDKTTESTKQMGSAMDAHKANISKLTHEISLAENEVKSLATAFARTSDAAERMDISKVMRKQQAEIRNLTKNKDVLQGIVDGIEGAGKKAAPKLATSIGEAFSAAGSSAGPILAAGLVAASPFIGAAISGAIIGGAGVGGVIGGVILASRDARVQTAGKQLGHNLMSSLEQDAAVFVGPVLDGIDQIQAAFDDAEGHIQNIFSNSARYVAPLVDGLTGFLDPVIEGFDELVANAAPVIEAIRQGLGMVGEAIGEMFHSLSDNGVDAAMAIYAVFALIAKAIDYTGKVINGLTEAFGWLIRVAEKFGILNDDAAKALDSFRAAGDGAQGTLGNLNMGFLAATDSGEQLAQTIEEQNRAARDAMQANQSLFDSVTSVAEAEDRLKQSIKDNGKTLDVHSAKGRANRQALSGLVSALNAQYDASVKVNGEGRVANGVASSNYNSFLKAAAGLGISRSAAIAYARQLGLIPPKKNTNFTANTHDAAGRIAALQAQVNALRSKTITITVARRVTGSSASDSALAAALRKNFDATDSYAFAGEGAGTFRTGGASPVSVDNNVGVTVSLDGKPFRDYTASAIDDNNRRQAWRQKVGAR